MPCKGRNNLRDAQIDQEQACGGRGEAPASRGNDAGRLATGHSVVRDAVSTAATHCHLHAQPFRPPSQLEPWTYACIHVGWFHPMDKVRECSQQTLLGHASLECGHRNFELCNLRAGHVDRNLTFCPERHVTYFTVHLLNRKGWMSTKSGPDGPLRGV